MDKEQFLKVFEYFEKEFGDDVTLSCGYGAFNILKEWKELKLTLLYCREADMASREIEHQIINGLPFTSYNFEVLYEEKILGKYTLLQLK